MAGIKSFGGYLPYYTLAWNAFAGAWGGKAPQGERSIANWDEDSLTMAVEAAFDCLKGQDRNQVGAVFLASTTLPYQEKSCAGIVATVVDLAEDIRVWDFSNSLLAGINALWAAMDAVKAGNGKDVLVVAADGRLGAPNTSEEYTMGDAAAALLISREATAASIDDVYAVNDDLTDVWRRDSDAFVKSWEDRWVITHGYSKNVRVAVTGIMQRNNLTAADFSKVVFYSPGARNAQSLARELGFDPKTQLQDPMVDKIGNAGVAQVLLSLVAALDQARPGERILLAGYGNGSEAVIITVNPGIAEVQGQHRAVQGWLGSRQQLPSYEKYLAFRDLLPLPPELIHNFPSATVMWRTRDWVERCHASICRQCGTITFPIQRVCVKCRAKDDYDQVRLSDHPGKVFTYSLDMYAGGPNPPIVQTIIESEVRDARMYCLMTDCDPWKVAIDMPVELTFRKFHERGDFHNYFWKCRPIR